MTTDHRPTDREPPAGASPCAVDEAARGTPLEARLAILRAFRDGVMCSTARGRRYVEDLQRHTAEILAVFEADPELGRSAAGFMGAVVDVIESGSGPAPRVISDALIAKARDLIAGLGHDSSPGFASTLERLQHELETFRELTPAAALAAAGEP
jgi:hypothetical protein